MFDRGAVNGINWSALIGTEAFATMDSAMAVEIALLNLVLGIESPP